MYFLNKEALDVYDQFDKQICTKLNNLWQNGQSLKMKTAVSEEGKERHLVLPAGCDAVCDVQLYPSTAIPLLWASTPTHPKAVYGLSNYSPGSCVRCVVLAGILWTFYFTLDFHLIFHWIGANWRPHFVHWVSVPWCQLLSATHWLPTLKELQKEGCDAVLIHLKQVCR